MGFLDKLRGKSKDVAEEGKEVAEKGVDEGKELVGEAEEKLGMGDDGDKAAADEAPPAPGGTA
jgi:hypothetical protein